MTESTPCLNKRPLSEGNTPSPSTQEASKYTKMDQPTEETGVMNCTGINYSLDLELNLAKTGEFPPITTNLLPADAPEEKWQYVLRHLETIKEEVTILKTENIRHSIR